MNCILGHRLLSFLLLMLLACTRRRHSLSDHSGGVNCILGHRLLSFLLLMLLACTRRRHSRHAKPYPKVILERRKHLFGSFGECELHFWPPKYFLLKTIPKTTPKPHPSCSHGAAVLQVVYKSRLRLPSHRTAVRAARRTHATCSWFWHMPWTERIWAKFSGCLNDTLNDTSTTPGKRKRRATAYPSISGGQRVGPAPPPMLAGGLEPASKSMSWSLWGGAASTPFLPSCLPAFLPSCLPVFLFPCLPAFLPSCLPAFLPSCLLPLLPSFFFCPASLPLLPCLPSSSSLPLPPFLFLPPLPPSFFPCPILPCSLTPWIPLSLPPHPSSLRPFSSCFLFLPVSLPLLSSPILSLSPFHPSLT